MLYVLDQQWPFINTTNEIYYLLPSQRTCNSSSFSSFLGLWEQDNCTRHHQTCSWGMTWTMIDWFFKKNVISISVCFLKTANYHWQMKLDYMPVYRLGKQQTLVTAAVGALWQDASRALCIWIGIQEPWWGEQQPYKLEDVVWNVTHTHKWERRHKPYFQHCVEWICPSAAHLLKMCRWQTRFQLEVIIMCVSLLRLEKVTLACKKKVHLHLVWTNSLLFPLILLSCQKLVTRPRTMQRWQHLGLMMRNLSPN